jgi:hypothetical protein
VARRAGGRNFTAAAKSGIRLAGQPVGFNLFRSAEVGLRFFRLCLGAFYLTFVTFR